MGRLTLKTNNFSSGEISPRLVGLSDLDRYQTAALKLENMLPLLQGGAVRRPGFLHAGAAAAAATPGAVRLVPYAASRADAALLVLTPGTMRIFTDDGPVLNDAGTPLELATPWLTPAQLQALDWAQDADTLYLVEGDAAPQRLKHVGGLFWTLAAVPFVTTPRDEIGHRFPGVTLTLSGGDFTMPGAPLVATASRPVFLFYDSGRNISSGDHGRFIEGAGGRAQITGATLGADGKPTGGVDVKVVEPFAMGVLAPASATTSAWELSDSPRSTLTLSGGADTGAQPVGQPITLSLDSAAPGWRAQDVGSWVDVDGGLVEILYYNDVRSVGGVVRKEIPSAVIAPPDAWRLLQPVWSDVTGWPVSVTLFEQRLVFGGNRLKPLDIWGSAISFPLDFAPGTLDTDSWDFRLSAEQAYAVRYTVGGRTLAALAGGTEFTLAAASGTITSTNVQVRQQTDYGTSMVRPVRVGTEVLFLSAGSRKLRAFAYRLENDAFAAPDLSVFSDHITAALPPVVGGVVDMAFQQEPDSILWLVRADGVLLSVTFDRDQGVIAWARHPTAGKVAAVGCTPLAEDQPDRLWIAVERGGVLRVEYLDQLDRAGQTRPTAMRADAGVVATSATPQARWPGLLRHLAAGTLVDVVGDGSDLGTVVVGADGTDGTITLPVAVGNVQAGLGFAGVLVPTVPELAGPGASGALAAVRSGKVRVRFLGGLGGQAGSVIDGVPVLERLPGPPVAGVILGAAPVPQEWSGELTRLGWTRGPVPLQLQQDRPMPFHVLAVIHQVGVNDG